MKTRRVVVTLELESDRPLTELRDRGRWYAFCGQFLWSASTVDNPLVQVRAKVIRPVLPSHAALAKLAKKSKRPHVE